MNRKYLLGLAGAAALFAASAGKAYSAPATPQEIRIANERLEKNGYGGYQEKPNSQMYGSDGKTDMTLPLSALMIYGFFRRRR